MSHLPDRTRLPEATLARAHAPRAGDYTEYRACCRWDFGFCCALCFLHEGDLIEGGAEGTGLVWIEHSELQSVETNKRDVYTNCFLSCRFCNNGRSTRPSVDPKSGATLLEPTTAVWSERFVVDANDVMTERDPEDRDAKYTRISYALDAERKAVRRGNRARRFRALRTAAALVADLVPKLLEKAKTDASEGPLAAAAQLLDAYDHALAEVKRYRAIPPDAPRQCRCATLKRELPTWLADQLQEVRPAGP